VFLGVALALLVTWAVPATAHASDGTLTVHPRVLHPGEAVTVCGSGFSYAGDRVVSVSIDGLLGVHTKVESDGTACIDVAYSDFRKPYNRFVPLFLTAQGASGGSRTDSGRVFVSSSRLPSTGAPALVSAASAGGVAVIIGVLMVALGRRRTARPFTGR